MRGVGLLMKQNDHSGLQHQALGCRWTVRGLIPFSSGLLLLCLLSGCINLATDYPRKNSYLLDISREDSALAADPPGAILQIREFRVSPRFDDTSLVYRMDENTYVVDYYNRFLVAPDIMISEEVYQWMESTGLFEHVLDRTSPLDPDYFLEGDVSVLYGDFTHVPPLARMETEFTLLRDQAEGSSLLLQKEYRAEILLSGRSPEALINGFGEALEAILTSFEKDLREIDLTQAP